MKKKYASAKAILKGENSCIKSVAFILFFFLLLSGQKAWSQKNNQTDTISTVIHCDHCLQCETCKWGLDDQLYKVKGVKNVIVDVARQQIIVSYNPSKTSLAAIKQAINNAGYDAGDQKATEEAVGKLDGCCRKP